ncbi:MAG: VWA domain-containing protein [Planctomycetes bacterium]|nr:VWA domain-containing protein [Planctomycetota bacterium]
MEFREPLFLLLLVFPAGFYYLRARATKKSPSMHYGLKSLLLAFALTALALAKPEIDLIEGPRKIALLFDVSHSAFDRIDVARELETLATSGRLRQDDIISVTLFAGWSRTILSGERLSEAPSKLPTPLPNIAGGATNFASALEEIPPDADFAIVFTDGAFTHSRSETAAATRFAAQKDTPELHFVWSDLRRFDARIADIVAPLKVNPSETFAVEVELIASDSCEAILTASSRESGAEIFRRKIDLAPDAQTRAILNFTAPESGFVELEFRIDPSDENPEHRESGHYLANNVGSVTILVRSEVRNVLLFSSLEDSQIQRALESSVSRNVVVRRSSGAALEVSLADLIIVEDYPADKIPLETMESIVNCAFREGCGFLMLGAGGAFAPGGYADTIVEERLLPVKCARDDRRLNVLLLLDVSSSMSEPLAGASRSATRFDVLRAAVGSLSAKLLPGDGIGLITFAGRADFPAGRSFVPMSNRAEISAGLSAVRPFGPTDVRPALGPAKSMLEGSDAPLNHVVLITDGRQLAEIGDANARLEAFFRETLDLGASITVLSVDDAPTLDYSALSGNPDANVLDATIERIPELLLEDIRKKRSYFEPEPGNARLENAVAGFEDAPGIEAKAGEIVTSARREEGVLIYSVEKDDLPLVAIRRVGAGISGAILLDPSDKNMAGELAFDRNWNVFLQNFILRLIRDHSENQPEIEARENSQDDSTLDLVITFDHAEQAPEERMFVRLTPIGTGGPGEVFPLIRESATRFEVHSVPASATGRLAVVESASGAVIVRTVISGRLAREFFELAPRQMEIQTLASLSGGAVVKDARAVRIRNSESAAAYGLDSALFGAAILSLLFWWLRRAR